MLKRWIWSWVDWKRLGCGSRERNAHFSQTRLYTWDTRLTNMDFIQCKIRWREAILKPRSPENVHELHAFLVVLNYYGRFLYNLSTVLAPLHKLLCKGQKWLRGPPQQRSLQRAKELLLSAEMLAHYDPYKPIMLQCDASNYGLDALLWHSMEDGTERWICIKDTQRC